MQRSHSRRIALIVAFATGLQAGAVSVVAVGVSAAQIEVYYAPEDLPGDRLVTLYERATKHVYVAMYSITYPPAVKALITAKKRGVDVRVITDRSRVSDRRQGTALETLHLAGVPIRINQHDALMHLKQVVIDDDVTVSGSMNQTTSGNRYNDERLDIITDAELTTQARNKFLEMWEDRERFANWKE
jgi:phosphatidylserine/phosphatidylglycerophosphate/cardiolipin synthase-like enzyme